MTFFLRNISISILVLALAVGSLAIYLSGRVMYEAMLNQVFSERVAVIETLGKFALEGKRVDEAKPIDTNEDALRALLLSLGQKPGVIFFRVIDVGTGKIIASANVAEEGSVVKETLPDARRGLTSVKLDDRSEIPVVELSYLGSGNRLLWMSIDRSFFANPAIVAGIQQGILLLAAFGLFGILFYVLIRRFFMKPVQELKRVLVSVEGTEKDNKKKKSKLISSGESFGELLESFSDVARRIEVAIEHDKVVSQTKSDFISTTAHQFRTPLSGINWALGSILSGGENLTEEQRTLIERSVEKTKELVAIVGELLGAASIEQGKLGFHREEFSLKEEIEKTLEEERQMALKNKITISFEHEDEDYPSVYVDRERIRWVIRNLIENAMRYGKEGGSVVVTLMKDRSKLTVSVKDDGIGISPEEQQHIFEKFFRGEEAKRKRNDGSGIGLFIIKNIINYHGGRMWFESVEGVGTTFFFTVPLARSVAKTPKT